MRGSRTGSLRCALAVAAIAALCGASAAPALASAPRARVGSVTPRPLTSHVVSAAPAARRLRVTVELQPRDPLGLQAFATAVSTPGSSQYGHFESVRQFADRFGARPADAARVARALRRFGLHVGALTRNNMQLPVSGTVGSLQRAFAVRELRVRMASGRVAYANAQPPTLPVAVAPYVQGVIGLDDLVLDRPAGLARPRRSGVSQRLGHVTPKPDYPTNGGPQPCASATDVNANENGLTADAIATAYGFPALYGQGDLGAGQTIALFEEEDFSLTAVQTYGACYGISINPQVINVAGGPPANQDAGESELDIEVVAGMAPQAKIQVYQGPGGQAVAIDNAIVSADQAKVISSSWGACEAITGGSTITAENTILQEAAAQGQSFFISSGDSGSSMCFQADPSQTQLSVIDPGGQPFATGVGGTNIYTESGGIDAYYQPGEPVFQSVWNDGYSGGRASGSGGGLSSSFAMPSYQSSAPASLGVINSGSSPAPCGGASDCREVPDVSADADPNTGYAVYTTGSGGPAWSSVGGTSAAAPLWASFAALANASGTCRGLTLGFVNPSLYAIAGSAYNGNFGDITNASVFTGYDSNDALQINGDLYGVTPGYDMATGLGSMNAGPLAQSLCAARAPVYTVAVADPGNLSATVGTPVAVQIHATDSGNAALGYVASGLPAGLAINSSTGAITGTPTTPGASAVTVAAGDGYANTGSTQFTFTIAAAPSRKHASGRPTSSRFALAGLAHRRPRLSFTLRGGNSALKAFTVSVPRGLGFARRSRTLDRHITIRAGRKHVSFRARVSRRTLTVVLRKHEKTIAVRIVHPALTITRREARAIKHRKVRTLAITIGATNAKRLTARHKVTLRRLR